MLLFGFVVFHAGPAVGGFYGQVVALPALYVFLLVLAAINLDAVKSGRGTGCTPAVAVHQLQPLPDDALPVCSWCGCGVLVVCVH